jgi:hypothetical protein
MVPHTGRHALESGPREPRDRPEYSGSALTLTLRRPSCASSLRSQINVKMSEGCIITILLSPRKN